MLNPSTRLRLETQLECLPILLAGTVQRALERRATPEKWTARENLAHLARYQNVFLTRLERLVVEDRPILPRYRAEDDPDWSSWREQGTGELLSELQIRRKQIIQRVATLSDSDLEKIGIHSNLGDLTVVQWLEFFLLHEAHHLLAIFQRTRETSN